jgi:hypothetical protein
MADQFSQAVTALLHQNDPTVRQQANAWLQQLQLAPHAWTVCSEVLEGSFNIDAKFYAAQTLRTKVLHTLQHDLSLMVLSPTDMIGAFSDQRRLSKSGSDTPAPVAVAAQMTCTWITSGCVATPQFNVIHPHALHGLSVQSRQRLGLSAGAKRL